MEASLQPLLLVTILAGKRTIDQDTMEQVIIDKVSFR